MSNETRTQVRAEQQHAQDIAAEYQGGGFRPDIRHINLRDGIMSLCDLDQDDAQEYILRNLDWVNGQFKDGLVAEQITVLVGKNFGIGLTAEEQETRDRRDAEHYGYTYEAYMALADH